MYSSWPVGFEPSEPVQLASEYCWMLILKLTMAFVLGVSAAPGTPVSPAAEPTVGL